MMWTLALVVGLAGQTGEKVWVDKMDPLMRRRFYEAFVASQEWAEWKTNQLYPDEAVSRLKPENRAKAQRDKADCKRELKRAAFEQICLDCDISRWVFLEIINRKEEVLKTPYKPDFFRRVETMPKDQLPNWRKRESRFNPSRVHLHHTLAKRFHFDSSKDLPGSVYMSHRFGDPKPRMSKEDVYKAVGIEESAPEKPKPSLKDQLLANPDSRDRPPQGSRDRPDFPALPARRGPSGR
jgi:hypothetical protein